MDLNKEKKLKKNSLNYDFVINASGYGLDQSLEKKKSVLSYKHFQIIRNLIKKLNLETLEKFIQIGSSMEYGLIKGPISEESVCKPNTFYGKSKLKCTNYLLKKFNREKFPSLIFRIFQVYGPDQSPKKIIPFIISNCKKNNSFSLTKGDQFRDFLYIDDMINAIFKSLTKKSLNGEIINLGSGKPIRIKNLVKSINKYFKKGMPRFGKKNIFYKDNLYLYPNIQKSKDLLNFKPKIKLLQGVRKIIDKI